MKTFLLSFFLFILNSLTFSQVENFYKLTLDNPATGIIHVTAELHIQGDTLRLHPSCPNYDFPEGWSEFISNLTIKSGSGRPIPFHYAGKSKWVLDKAHKKISVSYDVDLRYAKIKWDVGNEQSGYYDGKTLYSVTKPFFIFNTNNSGNSDNNKDIISKIEFDIPSQWEISVPWLKINPKTFLAKSNNELIDNSLVLGEQSKRTVKSGDHSFIISLLPGINEEEAGLLGNTLEKVLGSHLKTFASAIDENYLITVFHADQDDGESFNNSIAFTQKNIMNERNMLNWANTLSHELFHYWNGRKIKVGGAMQRWFQEGFTEYYANLSLVRNNIITKEEFYQKAQFMMGLYMFIKWRYSKLPLDSAGVKSQGEYRFFVYNGGWTIAMALDMMIRKASSGMRSLDDVMNLLNSKYSGTGISTDQLIEALNVTAPADYRTFFDEFISGTKTIPVNDYLKFVGLEATYIDYQGELYLTEINDNSYEVSNRNDWLQGADSK